nr:MAG TPA: hypothetical protein [Caudoviricetes sp.]
MPYLIYSIELVREVGLEPTRPMVFGFSYYSCFHKPDTIISCSLDYIITFNFTC